MRSSISSLFGASHQLATKIYTGPDINHDAKFDEYINGHRDADKGAKTSHQMQLTGKSFAETVFQAVDVCFAMCHDNDRFMVVSLDWCYCLAKIPRAARTANQGPGMGTPNLISASSGAVHQVDYKQVGDPGDGDTILAGKYIGPLKC